MMNPMDAFVSLFSDPLVLAASIVVLLALVAAVVWAVHRSKTPSAPTPTAMPSAPVEAAPDAAEDLEPTSAGPADEPAESIEEPEEPTGESVEEAEAPAGPVEEGAPEEPSRDVPESLPSRMRRLRSRLAGSGALGRAIVRVLSRGDLEAADWEEIED